MPKTHSSKKLPALISGAAVWYFSQVCDKVSYSYLSFYKRRRSKKASVLAGSENLMFFLAGCKQGAKCDFLGIKSVSIVNPTGWKDKNLQVGIIWDL